MPASIAIGVRTEFRGEPPPSPPYSAEAWSRHIDIRVEGDYQHTNFALIQSEADPVPYRIPGIPNSFGRFSTGLGWTPCVYPAGHVSAQGNEIPEKPVESELAFEARTSFGHSHIFAGTWWS